jgi:D-alanyl-D-alanine carboxypeptidase (penicillin-binding protein 5/6)
MHKPARRLILAFLFAFAACFGASVSQTALAQPFYLNTDSKYAAIVLDAATGEVLYARNPDATRYPASISKIMTLYLAFDALSTGRLKPDDRIVVSAHANGQKPSKLGLRIGESISVDDAIRAIAVKSANDMAVALAERIGGSESKFATMMTLRAQELGMTNTHYVNASGLPDPRQVSSARDIATLSRAVMRDYPQYYSYFSLKQFSYHGQTINNHNGLLGKMQGVDGLKTGFINASGYNLAASAVRDHHRLIAVVLGGNSTAARDNHVEDLLDSGFAVMRRRQLGDHVTVAQLLEEPTPIGPIARPSVEQGSGEQAGVKIVLSHPELASLNAAEAAPAQAKPVRVAANDLTPDDAQPANDRHARARKTEADWQVQVGAFKNKKQAKSELATIKHRFSKQLEDGRPEIEGVEHGYYRARFTGLTAAEAHNACAVLSRKHQRCAAYGPS